MKKWTMSDKIFIQGLPCQLCDQKHETFSASRAQVIECQLIVKTYTGRPQHCKAT